MAVNEEILLDVKVQNADALANIGKLSEANAKLKKELSDLNDAYKKGEVSEAENGRTKALITAQIKENTAGIRENSKEIKTNAASVASAADSINGMRARVADLNVAWNSMSAAAREGDAGKAIQKEMASLNDSVNVANKSINNFKDNVGNYPDAMANMGLANTKVGKTLDTLGITAESSMKSVGDGVSSMVKTVITSMKALLANPIILIVTLIVGAFLALVAVFKDFKPLVDKVEQSMAALGATFSVLKNTVIALFTGQKSLSESTKGLGDAMGKAARQAAELKKAQQELEDAQDGLDIKNKRDETQIQKLMLQSKNRTLTEKERIALLDEAQKKSEDIFKRNKAQNDQEVKNAEDKIIIGKNLTDKEIARLRREGSEYARQLQDKRDISDEEIKVLTAALLKREDINQQYVGIQEKAQNKIDALADAEQSAREKAEEKAQAAREKRLAAIQKAHDDEIKKAENLLTLKKTNQKDLDAALLTDPKYFKERLTMLEQNSKDEQAINALKYKKNSDELKIANANSDKELASGKLALQKQLADQSIKALDYELQLSKIQNETLLAGQKLTNEQLHKNRISDIETANKEELSKLKIQLDAKIINESEYLDAVQLKNAEKNLKIAQDNADFEASERERKIQAQSDDYANELSLLQEYSDRAVEVKKAQLDAQMKIELDAAKTNGANVELIQLKYAKSKKAIDKTVSDAKLDQEKRIADGIMNLFGKTTKAGKAAASASVAIDTYKGAQAAITGMAGAGPVGWALGAIEAGVIIAGGAKSISDIWAVNENVASSVSSTTSTAASSATQNTGTTYTNLPTIASMYGSNASQNETAQIIAQSAPAPVVSVTEITNMQNTVQVKENSKL